MKFISIFITILIFIQLSLYGQDTFTSRCGSKFFPGHLEIVLTIDSNSVRYELFNHWYSGSFAEMRQIKISLDSIEHFNASNDTISIDLHGKYAYLTDRKYNIKKKIDHTKLCTSTERMRKISYAYRISTQLTNIRHYQLYNDRDLELSESDFEKTVIENSNKLKNNDR